jgi:hypothetical protein
MAKPTIHLSSSKRAESIGKIEQQPGNPVPSELVSDTVNQSANIKPGKLQKEDNALVAKLDQGPLGA